MTARYVLVVMVATLTISGVPRIGATQIPYVHFESGPVRPVALSPDGSTLFVTNIPDSRLEILDVTATGLQYRASVSVGLGPVAVAVRSNSEVGVVNHLSDSVSIVDTTQARVLRTLEVGDEPRDIVFGQSRAFITTAHRGQRRTHTDLNGVPGAGDPQFTTPGVGRADLWVFDVDTLGTAPGGVPSAIVTLFGDTPRALAVSPDGTTVYAAIFNSGNGTTVIPEAAVCNGFESAGSCEVDGAALPGGNPGPATNTAGDPAPEVGLIVKYQRNLRQWTDELGRNWSGAVRFNLPDYDVFALDVQTLEETRAPSVGVGTTLFNMTVNPATGALYVSNTESRNHVRFEGPGASGHSTVQGDLARSQITVIRDNEVSPRHLNKHINYSSIAGI